MNAKVKSTSQFVCVVVIALIAGFKFARAERPIRGVYEVPVNASLAAFASYPVKYKADDYQGQASQMTFPLPAELVGQELPITMNKVAGSDNAWSGSNVDGLCEAVGREFVCKVKFHGLAIDSAAVEAAVRARFPAPDQFSGRMQVAMQFSGEPIGILKYRLRGRSSEGE